MRRVRTAEFLPLHPGERQLFELRGEKKKKTLFTTEIRSVPVGRVYLCRQDDQRDANHDDHVELRGPNVRHEIAVTDRRKCDYHVVSGLKEAQVSVTGPLKVLYAAYALRPGNQYTCR